VLFQCGLCLLPDQTHGLLVTPEGVAVSNVANVKQGLAQLASGLGSMDVLAAALADAVID